MKVEVAVLGSLSLISCMAVWFQCGREAAGKNKYQDEECRGPTRFVEVDRGGGVGGGGGRKFVSNVTLSPPELFRH